MTFAALRVCSVTAFLAGLLLASVTAAPLAVPALTGHITDTTGTLSAEQKAALEARLAAFEASKGSQVAVLMVASTAPEAIEQYALRVAESWKLGRKNADDGAILVIAKDQRSLRIEVGYGLEGALNDATSKRIISEAIVPRFKAQDYYGGITAGVDQLLRVIDGEVLPKASSQIGGADTAVDKVRQFAPLLLMVALVAGGLLRTLLGKVPGALVAGGVVGLVAWFMAGALSVALIAAIVTTALSLFGGMGLLLGARGMGGLGGGYYGGGGYSGGGGGFSGGGGSFGGGGASGRW